MEDEESPAELGRGEGDSNQSWGLGRRQPGTDQAGVRDWLKAGSEALGRSRCSEAGSPGTTLRELLLAPITRGERRTVLGLLAPAKPFCPILEPSSTSVRPGLHLRRTDQGREVERPVRRPWLPR